MEPREPKESCSDFKQQFNLLRALAQIASFPVEIFTTRLGTWGHRHLTGLLVFGCFWPPVFAAFSGPHRRIGDLFGFWFISLGLLLAHRIAGVYRRRRGYRCHSQFWGNSWMQRGTGLKAQRRARLGDGALAIVVGWIVFLAGSGPLGALLLIGGLAKLLNDMVEFQSIEARLRQMEDARIENEYYAALYRERIR